MTLYHGDCLAIMPTLPAQSVDAVICDPPYGTTACKWDSVIPFEPMWRELKRIIKPRGAIVLFGSQPFTSALVMSNPRWYRHSWVWDKVLGTGHLNVSRRPLNRHDDIVVFADAQPKYNPQNTPRLVARRRNERPRLERPDDVYGDFNRPAERQDDYSPTSILPFSNADRTGTVHPTQKPVALMEYLIRTYTNEGDTVLDFAAGSGTTAVAAINTGRKFIAIEQDANYYAIAERRISDAQAALVQLELVA